MVRHDHAIERPAGVGFLQEIARIIQQLGQTGRAGEDVGQSPAPVIAVGHVGRAVGIVHHPQFAGVVIRVVSRDTPRPRPRFQPPRRRVGVNRPLAVRMNLVGQPAPITVVMPRRRRRTRAAREVLPRLHRLHPPLREKPGQRLIFIGILCAWVGRVQFIFTRQSSFLVRDSRLDSTPFGLIPPLSCWNEHISQSRALDSFPFRAGHADKSNALAGFENTSKPAKIANRQVIFPAVFALRYTKKRTLPDVQRLLLRVRKQQLHFLRLQ